MDFIAVSWEKVEGAAESSSSFPSFHLPEGPFVLLFARDR